MLSSRTDNSIRNSLIGTLNNIANILFGFIYRTVFIYVLSKEYLGLNGLFSNILTILSIAELGIGSAINFRLYKPVAENNKTRIIQLILFYKRVYIVIALVIGLLGLSLTPFLHLLIADLTEIPTDINVYHIYMLFLLGQVSTYIFVYKQSLIIAYQKEWILSLCNMIGHFFQYCFMIIVLFVSKDFTLVLITQIFFTLLINIVINLIANYMYPFIKKSKSIIEKSERKIIFKETRAVLNHKIGSVVLNGTDNILISAFVGLGVVGVFSNYNLISNYVVLLLTQLVSSLTASIGNLYVKENKNKLLNVYLKVQYVNVFLCTFVMLSFFLLVDNFIELWLGIDYKLNIYVVIIITFLNLIKLYRTPNIIFIQSCGLYMKDRWRPAVEVALNLMISIVALKKYGISGIFFGTIISMLLVPTWREYVILNKFAIQSKEIKKVPIFKFFVVLGASILGFLYYLLFSVFPVTIGFFILKFFICLITIPIIFFLLTIKLPENKYLIEIIQKLFSAIRITIKKLFAKCAR